MMPAYPFIAVFLGQHVYSIATKHIWVNRTYSIISACIIGVVMFLSVFILLGVIDLQDIAGMFTKREKTLFHTTLIDEALSTPTALYIVLLLCLLASLCVLVFQLRKMNQKGIIYATIGAWLMCLVLLDGVALPAFKDGTSIKPFTNEIMKKYPLKEGNMYVMNNLHVYANLYGANFYLHNKFMNFEKVKPEEGFFFSTATDIEKVKDKYKEYKFELLEESPNRFNDTRAIVQLYKFQRQSVAAQLSMN